MHGRYALVFLGQASANPYAESDEKHKAWAEGYQACENDWRKAAQKLLHKLTQEGLEEV